MQYLVVIEQGPNSVVAHAPDLAGCIAAAESREEVSTHIQEAMEMHIEDLRAQAQQGLAPHSSGELANVDA